LPPSSSRPEPRRRRTQARAPRHSANQPCHDLGPEAKNKLGPKLNGLEGRKAGTIEGFDYTEANKNSGITWNDETFKEYIKDPRAKIPGTKMVFAGIKDEKEAGDLWGLLKQFGPDGSKK
jgi:cytochrome c